MVKPALSYLDVIHSLNEHFTVPITAYNVSGEYAMVKAAAMNGWLDYDATVEETLLSMRRAGASRSEEHTSELQSRPHLVCRLLLEKKKKKTILSPRLNPNASSNSGMFLQPPLTRSQTISSAPLSSILASHA